LGVEGEKSDIFVFHETPHIARSVFGVQKILHLLVTAALDPEEDGESDDGDTADTPNDTADDRTNDGLWVGASSKADQIIPRTAGVTDLDDGVE